MTNYKRAKNGIHHGGKRHNVGALSQAITMPIVHNYPKEVVIPEKMKSTSFKMRELKEKIQSNDTFLVDIKWKLAGKLIWLEIFLWAVFFILLLIS